MYQENVNQSRWCVLRLVVTIAMLLGAGSSSNLAALDTINVFYPSPAPFYIPVAVTIHQDFFREQNLDVKWIVTGGNFTKDGMLVDAALKPLVDDQLAGHQPQRSGVISNRRFEQKIANESESFSAAVRLI